MDFEVLAAPYTLELTAGDVSIIARIGGGHAWSDVLADMEAGANRITGAEAFELRDAFYVDTCGGAFLFPGIAPGSKLRAKLVAFLDALGTF